MKNSLRFGLLAAFLIIQGSAMAGVLLDGDFEGGFSGFTANWNPHATYANDMNVSSSVFGGDAPQGGSWYVFFADGIPITNYISQTFATNVGDTYVLTFWLALQNDNVSDGSVKGSGNYLPQLAVVWTGSSIHNLNFGAAATQSYTLYTYTYVATAATTTLEFAGADSYNTALLLDTVNVTDLGAIPEPATFGLAGAGLIAALYFKRKRS